MADKETNKNNLKKDNIPALLGFIFSLTGLLVIPGLILSIIGLTTNKDYKRNRKELAIAGTIISSVLLFLFFISICFGFYNVDESNVVSDNKETNEKIEVKMIEIPDFSTMNKEDTEKWCNENYIECNITEDYSDLVESGKLISQSVEKNTEVEEDSKVDIVYSKGHKKTSEEVKMENRARCKDLDYREVLRNPSNYDNEYAHWFGKVFQVVTKEGLYKTYLINVNCEENSYAAGGYICSDGLYVSYVGDLNLIEDDMVELWGIMDKEAYTYTTVLGASKTIPKITTFDIELR